jgi:signal peptidase II
LYSPSGPLARLGPGRYLLLALAVIVADQWSKASVLAALAPGDVRACTSFFDLVLTFNRGAAFSLLADQPGWQNTFFVTLAIGVSGLIVWMLGRHRQAPLFCTALGLILGGAIGNLIDRLQIGAVVDFLSFHAGGWYWPAFNVADSSITLGAVLVILDSLRGSDVGHDDVSAKADSPAPTRDNSG